MQSNRTLTLSLAWLGIPLITFFFTKITFWYVKPRGLGDFYPTDTYWYTFNAIAIVLGLTLIYFSRTPKRRWLMILYPIVMFPLAGFIQFYVICLDTGDCL